MKLRKSMSSIVAGWLGLSAMLWAMLSPGTANAQADYPNRPVKIIVPFSAGGLSDNLMRLFGKELWDRFGQPFILDFKPGAATNLGAAAVATAPPDGYTLFVSTMASHVLNKWSYKSLSYDADAMVNVGMVGAVTSFLLVRSDSPFRSVEDLVRAARRAPGAMSYGSHGAGGPNHLLTELFLTKAGISQLVHVPYKGMQQSSADLIGGRIDFMIDAGLINLVDGGRLRALAVAYPGRLPMRPSIPTMSEAGYPDATMTAFFGIAAPAGTPPAIADKLNLALREIAAMPAIEKQMLAMNVMPLRSTRQETAEFIREQSAKWGPMLKALNITFD